MSTVSYFVGLGCRRDCSAQSLHTVLQQSLSDCGLSIEQIEGIASIDSKKEEAGLLELAKTLEIPLTFFPAAHLNTFSDSVSDPSASVLDATGTHSVAEASALALAETRGGDSVELVSNKQKNADATCAVARASIA
jgi:cobalt-precorrin 5A hydrolase